VVRLRPEGCPTSTHRGKRILRAGRWQGLDASSNVLVIRAVGPGPYNRPQ